MATVVRAPVAERVTGRWGVTKGIISSQRILRAGYTVLPIVAGLDKYFDALGPWNNYLNPAVASTFPGGAPAFMHVVGAIEIAAGILVGLMPSLGGLVVGVWLLGIVANLLTIPGFFDIALRDFGLSLGAFSLALLSRDIARHG